MTTRKTPPEYLRMHLHLDENTARQVRLQAHKWSLNDTQTVKQLIRMGLDSARANSQERGGISALSETMEQTAEQLRVALLENMLLTRECFRALHPSLTEEQRMARYKAMRASTLETLKPIKLSPEFKRGSRAEPAPFLGDIEAS